MIVLSDRRLKEDVKELPRGLGEIMKLRPVDYLFRQEGEKGRRLGFIAQEVEALIPEVVSVGADPSATRGIRYNDLLPLLVKAVQERDDAMKERKMRLLECGESNHQLLREISESEAANRSLEKYAEKLARQNAHLKEQLSEALDSEGGP
ncbi:MAG: tail fiber domain-containing protein [Planctomycetes bacterium]|nr:tail fiber domain-containing protein [Planctomycetota bacterium]